MITNVDLFISELQKYYKYCYRAIVFQKFNFWRYPDKTCQVFKTLTGFSLVASLFPLYQQE